MNESMKKFLEKMAQDQELVVKMSAMQDPDEAYKLASSVQDGFTKEEFITTVKELAAANNDLTDDDLKQFGGTDSSIVSMSLGASLSATAGSACLVAAAI